MNENECEKRRGDERSRRENKRAAREMALDAAMKGDPICGAYFALEALARRHPEGEFMIDTQDVDFEDDSDEIRPY